MLRVMWKPADARAALREVSKQFASRGSETTEPASAPQVGEGEEVVTWQDKLLVSRPSDGSNRVPATLSAHPERIRVYRNRRDEAK